MASKIDTIILDGINYTILAPDMETLMKIKWIWKYTKTTISDLSNEQLKFIINGKKDEAIEVITTYISWETWFHKV